MTWAAALKGLLIALPDLIKGMNDIIALFKGDAGGFIKDVGSAMRKLKEEADTPEKKREVAKRLNDLIKDL